MRLRAILIAIALALASCLPASRSYAGFSIPYPILIALADIQREFSVETVYCLGGHIDKRGAIVISNMWPPIVTERSPTHARYVTCGDAVAWYHNHPVDTYCQPSSDDVGVLEHRDAYHALLLSCSHGSFAYQFKGDTTVYRLHQDSYRAVWDTIMKHNPRIHE